MTKFTVDISDASQLAGITAAREAYNHDNAEAEGFVPIETDAVYVQFVMERAAASYAVQHGV